MYGRLGTGESTACTTTITTFIGVMMMGQPTANPNSLQNQVQILFDFNAALKLRGLPAKATLAELLDYVYREGAQVERLIPNANLRAKLIEQEQGCR